MAYIFIILKAVKVKMVDEIIYLTLIVHLYINSETFYDAFNSIKSNSIHKTSTLYLNDVFLCSFDVKEHKMRDRSFLYLCMSSHMKPVNFLDRSLVSLKHQTSSFELF